MLGALTPLGKVATSKAKWFWTATAFTLSGLLSSVLVGALLARLGAALGVSLDDTWAVVLATVLAALVAVRELGLVPLPLLERRRATRGALVQRLGQPRAAIAWGLDIGLLFTTWLTFAGAWWLVAVTVLSADPLLGGALFAAYWAGRALTIWLGPWIVPSASATPKLIVAWSDLHRPFQLLHVAAVVTGALVLLATLPAA